MSVSGFILILRLLFANFQHLIQFGFIINNKRFSDNNIFIYYQGFLRASFTSIYFFNPSFTKTNPSWLIFDSFKTLETKTSVVFNLAFANNTIVVFFSFFNYWLILFHFCSYCKFLILLPIPLSRPTKETKVEFEKQPVTVETKIEEILNVI